MLFQALLAGSYVSVVCGVETCVSMDSVIVGLLLFQCSSGLPAYFSVDMFSCVLISSMGRAASLSPEAGGFPLLLCAVTVHRSSARCLVPSLRKRLLSELPGSAVLFPHEGLFLLSSVMQGAHK